PDANHHDGPPWRPDEHEVDRWCRLLAWYGIPADPGDLSLRRPEPGRAPAGVTVLHPGSKVRAKRWPAERFAAVARHLATAGHHVVITGDAAEQRLARHVAHLAGLPDDAILAGHTDLHHLAALVAHARLLISGDTGIAHLATAYHTPSVVLFGPVSPALWGPPPDRPYHRALWAAERDCPRWDGVGTHPTLAAVDVGEVLAAAHEVEQAVRTTGAVAA
ncbi:glycosyltransferase family 9 protein, partial [Micromonospora sp. NPDC126480]|uniref:glycosyltransferase family 9 protein n=1 Tax=Micromonospora sp. NPDC126480 TaxID=3155312 RepID=UPI00332AA77D